MYKALIRPILFLFDPEKVHHFTFSMIKFLSFIPGMSSLWKFMYQSKDEKLEREYFGLKFPNPVGLAAGFDKDAKLIDQLACFGFGFIEIGTLTPKGQPGNDKPRLFRLKKDQAIINRMGFNNQGVEAAVKRLKSRNSSILVGGNIGKNKVTPNEEAFRDYEITFNELFDHVDYFVVNVSSPNTPNLRALQDKGPLTEILSKLQALNNERAIRKPLLLKIAPDLTDEQLQDIVDIAKEVKLDGLIATNTTISREGLITSTEEVAAIGAGGVSGKPVKEKSTEVIKYLRKNLGPEFPIIGVGGIMSAEDAIEKLNAGASLVQVYTGFIYEGPKLIKDINRTILK
ncbi:quinone-dependent dihydroorotate dehydrogenase [Fulvivirga lutea]|uniref:Dihydroorotate dehydrogenase (quinone) n=1 Tax=Fulvivirga lutea TaxID=2810512 RepID=A0A974WFR3_9BACT|nr:quinone-dependent dihydroorotate dehydrogenase [Fulvivirga lutea]QSE97648.1 quinone-dependent dihydroorotate dehydrogenase [Fulvivirga lutea]